MLRPHSLLWHYLWIAPDVLLACLAFVMWKRRLYRNFPAFFYYLLFESVSLAVTYALDISPTISGDAYWRTYFGCSVIEVFVKFAVMGEIFTSLLRPYPPLGRLARLLVTSLGVILIFAATIIAAYSTTSDYWVISATRILGRSANVVQCGFIFFLFAFAAHFNLSWSRITFGITLGFAIISSVYLGYWALMADWLFGVKSYLLDFVGMATYHLCVLIWFYYLLVPERKATTPAVLLPENNLAIWNRELERLLQQ
jgi:hypothetical protein